MDEKELKDLRGLYEVIGRVLEGKPEEDDEEYLRVLLERLYD